MRWFQFTVCEFEASTNPPNAAMVVMNRVHIDKHVGRVTSSGINPNPVFGDQFVLDEESARLMNLSKNYTVAHQHHDYHDKALERIIEDAEEGYEITNSLKYNRNDEI